MGFSYGKSRYNAYRKRSFSRTDNQRREYAKKIEELEQEFEQLDEWYLSSMKDSAYKEYEKYTVRLSNHSADNAYHDLHDGKLLVNIRASKLEFIDIINNQLDKILDKINNLDLDKYRFINSSQTGYEIKCYYKGYKTKKDVI
ncbi:hypothetical protein KG090_00665 [Carnobacteriaceae bacterium zg-ZUI240]|nr:hypothetical protein [Carnobacteriaceae bacterium zg-ZUI240]